MDSDIAWHRPAVTRIRCVLARTSTQPCRCSSHQLRWTYGQSFTTNQLIGSIVWHLQPTLTPRLVKVWERRARRVGRRRRRLRLRYLCKEECKLWQVSQEWPCQSYPFKEYEADTGHDTWWNPYRAHSLDRCSAYRGFQSLHFSAWRWQWAWKFKWSITFAKGHLRIITRKWLRTWETRLNNFWMEVDY